MPDSTKIPAMTRRLENNPSRRGRDKPTFVIRTMQYFREPAKSPRDPDYHKIRARHRRADKVEY
jgi:hypothetical protein